MQALHTQAPLPELDSPIFGMIRHSLEKNRGDRYPDFKTLRLELELLLKQKYGEVVEKPPMIAFDAWELSNRGFSLSLLSRISGICPALGL